MEPPLSPTISIHVYIYINETLFRASDTQLDGEVASHVAGQAQCLTTAKAHL